MRSIIGGLRILICCVLIIVGCVLGIPGVFLLNQELHVIPTRSYVAIGGIGPFRVNNRVVCGGSLAFAALFFGGAYLLFKEEHHST